MLKRVALMLLVVPVQLFNFSLASHFLHGLRPHSQEVITEEVSITERIPCSGSALYGHHVIVESNRVVRFDANGQMSVESTLFEDEDLEDSAKRVDIETSACNEEGCENP